MDRGLVLYEVDAAEAKAIQDEDDLSDDLSDNESQDASSAAESAPPSAKKALDELHAELSRVNAAITELGVLVEKTSKVPGVKKSDLERFNGRVVKSTKKGALTELFTKSNESQVRMIADEIMATKTTKGLIAAFIEFQAYVGASDQKTFENAEAMRAAITKEFQKREDAKAAKAAKANARSAPVVHKSEGERTGHGRGRGGASKSEATASSHVKSDRSRGHGPHKGGDHAPAHEPTHETSRGPTRKPREARENRPSVGLGKSVAS